MATGGGGLPPPYITGPERRKESPIQTILGPLCSGQAQAGLGGVDRELDSMCRQLTLF